MNNRVKLLVKFLYGRDFLKYESPSYVENFVVPRIFNGWIFSTSNKNKKEEYFVFTSGGEIIQFKSKCITDGFNSISLQDYIRLHLK